MLRIPKKRVRLFLPPKNNIYPLEGDVALGMQDLDFFCFHSMCISRSNPVNLWPIRGPAQLPLEPAAHTEYPQGSKMYPRADARGGIHIDSPTPWLIIITTPDWLAVALHMSK